MSLQRTFHCSKDVRLVNNGGTHSGNGKGPTLSVGQISGNQTRSELEFECDFSGAVAVAEAYLRLKATEHCGAFGANVLFWVEVVTDGFQEGSYAGECDSSTSNAETWPGQASTTTHRVAYNNNPSEGGVIKVPITAMVEAARAAGDKKLRVRLIASDGASGYDESNSVRFVGFWSRQGDHYNPRIEVVLDDTYAPEAPADVTPATTNYQQQGQAATRVDTRYTVAGRYVQTAVPGRPAPYLAASQYQLWSRFANDDGSGGVTGGTKLQDTVRSNYPVGTLDLAHPVVVDQALVGQEVRGRVRVRGNNGKWSPWTLLAAQRLIPNNRPTAPTGLSLDDTSAAKPNYSGVHNDPDPGSAASAVETQVVRESSAGVEVIQNTTTYQPGDPVTGPYTTLNGTGAQDVAGGTLWTVPHAGRDLVTGERVKRRHRTADQFGAVGAWSPWVSTTVGIGDVPTVIPAPTEKQDGLAPLVGASYSENITGLLVEAYGKPDLASGVLWQPGEVVVASATSATIEYGSVGTAPTLRPGQPLYVRARVRKASSGALTDWSDLSLVWLNALPTAPVLGIDGAVLGTDGILRVGTLRPRIVAPFADPDLPNDAPTRQIATLLIPPGGGVPFYTSDLSTGIEDFVDVPTAAGLAWETSYLARLQYADSSSTLGPTADLEFTTHQPPDLAVGTAPAVADPRPTIRWVATWHGGDSQAGYRVAVVDVTAGAADVVLDTGFVADTTANSYRVPAYVLEDGHDYEATVTVTGVLGIATTLDGAAVVLLAATEAVEPDIADDFVLTVTTAPTGAPADAFTTRTVTDSWGTSTSGYAWEHRNHPEDFDVASNVGTMVLPTAGADRRARLVGPAFGNLTAVVKVKTDKLAVGGALSACISARSQDFSNCLRAELRFNTDATMDILLVSIIGGTRSILSIERLATTHVVADSYWLKYKVLGEGGGSGYIDMNAKVWKVGDSEPVYWDVFDTIIGPPPGPGSVGLDGLASAGVSNAPVTITFDDLSSTSP